MFTFFRFVKDDLSVEYQVVIVSSKFRFISVNQWPRRPRFNLSSSHTKNPKNGTRYLFA